MNKEIFTILKDTDIYSLSMFALYKLTDIPEYTTIGELPYILDRENLFKFCQYFGGKTIKVPTSEELQSLMYLLLLYQYVNIEKIEYTKALALIGYESKDLRKVKTAYTKLCNILEKYEFKARPSYN